MTATVDARAQLRDDPDAAADALPLGRIAGLFRPYRWQVLGLVAIAAAQAPTSVTSPFLLREIVDRALPERSASLVSWLAGGMLLAAAATGALGVGTTWLSNLIGQRVMHDLCGKWILSSRRAMLTMIPAVVYWIAGLALAHGSAPISIGTAVAFASMLNRLVGPATALQSAGVQYSTSIALFVRIFEVLDLPVDVADALDARPLRITGGEVRVENVSFRYDLSAEWTLRDIDFVVPPGTTTALVGETGSGKTTLAYLVARLYDPELGRVRIDGADLRTVTLGSAVDAIGLVAQDTYLFHDTIAANLRFAAPGASDEQLVAAASAARVHAMIAGPDGYDTIVGARGYRFSGGERQRLAIAHRLSTVRGADQFLVLDRGRIVERGTHDELVERGGRYATLAGELR